MKVGDKNQAIALSVVAVGAMVFLFSQLRARATVHNAQTIAPAVTSSVETHESAPSLPQTLVGDPFSHPALAQKTSKKDDPSVKGDKAPPSVRIGGSFGAVPLALPGISELKLEKATTPKAQTLSLQAVITAPSPVAFLSLDGKDSRQFTVGKSVTDHVVVASIRDGEIELRMAKGAKTLSVGETLKL